MKYPYAMLFVLLSLLLLPAARAAEAPLTNGGFEEGLRGWTIPVGEGMSTLSTEQAASGKYSLKVVDNTEKLGSDVTAARVPAQGPGVYELRGKAFPVSGGGLGIYVRVLDREGKVIGQGDDFQRGAPSSPVGQWSDFSLPVYTTADTAYLELWIHSYGSIKVTAYLDDFKFVNLGDAGLRPPWTGSYKIHPEERDRLTAADVVGPDGVVYPDWRYAGMPGGIPKVPVKARIEAFGGRANDNLDDSDALEQGAEAVGRQGGGALLLGAGTYYLDRPVSINRDGVVIRGFGAGRTRIIFRYGAPAGGVGFFRPLPGSTVTDSTWIEAHAAPKDLQALIIEVDGQQVAATRMHQHWGATFSLRTSGASVLKKVKDGPHTLKAIAEYANGKKIESTIPIRVAATVAAGETRLPAQIGAIMFTGISTAGPQLKLAQDGKRGDREITLESVEGLAVGDRIRLLAPATPRWNALVRNACKWGIYRRYDFQIEAINGNRVRLNQPLRIEYPIVDGSYIQEIQPIRRCGVEDLYLEQTQDIWTSGIVFSQAWECWARGVTVKKAGRFPLYFLNAKWCEIRDCVMDDAWFKGGGGTAYVGWEHSCDCLMENVITYKLRHAPVVQWAGSGNVIRKGVFHDSDAQWHSGWTNENLFEQCVVESVTGNGGYGYGMWASPPEDDAHGPNGPRNVVYNCDIRSPKAGLWMGGMNESWLILYNRFVVGSGAGVFAKTASFDHVIRGNVFNLADPKQPAVVLATPDCIGVELIGNRVYGGSVLTGGMAKPAVQRDNQMLPAGEAPRPLPAVPSIFEWERQHR